MTYPVAFCWDILKLEFIKGKLKSLLVLVLLLLTSWCDYKTEFNYVWYHYTCDESASAVKFFMLKHFLQERLN